TRSDRDWSSDVCSSDLVAQAVGPLQLDAQPLELLLVGVELGLLGHHLGLALGQLLGIEVARRGLAAMLDGGEALAQLVDGAELEIGRASCREKVWIGGV